MIRIYATRNGNGKVGYKVLIVTVKLWFCCTYSHTSWDNRDVLGSWDYTTPLSQSLNVLGYWTCLMKTMDALDTPLSILKS